MFKACCNRLQETLLFLSVNGTTPLKRSYIGCAFKDGVPIAHTISQCYGTTGMMGIEDGQRYFGTTTLLRSGWMKEDDQHYH